MKPLDAVDNYVHWMETKMNSFTKWIMAFAFATSIAGCGKSPDAHVSDAPPVNAKSEGPTGSGIAPMTMTPIPNAPVSGSETLQGGGSGVGQAMKGRAKDIATGSSSSVDSPPVDEDGGG